MSEHTKEPWKCKQRGKAGLVEVFVGDESTGRTEQIAEFTTFNNAKRVVACVNACEGISTQDLEVWHANGEFLEDLCLRRKDRMRLDMLLSAAKNLRDVKGRHHSEIAMNRLIEAIAEVESSNG